MRQYAYHQLDVFTSRPLEGNQLAVFPDAIGLGDDEMQAIARETNFSETTFVLRRDADVERERGFHTRVFTPKEELPFAGHPTLGTAWLLRQLRADRRPNEIVLDMKAGRVPVRFIEGEDGRAFGEMRQPEPVFGNVFKREDVAAALALELNDIVSSLPVRMVSTGLVFIIVPLRSVEVLQSMQVSWSRIEAFVTRADAKFMYFLAPDISGSLPKMRARMIWYAGEDPATGSAAGCAAAYFVEHGLAAPDQQVLIEQGVEAKRRSHLYVRAGRDGSRVTNVRVGGNVVEVVRGELTL